MHICTTCKTGCSQRLGFLQKRVFCTPGCEICNITRSFPGGRCKSGSVLTCPLNRHRSSTRFLHFPRGIYTSEYKTVLFWPVLTCVCYVFLHFRVFWTRCISRGPNAHLHTRFFTPCRKAGIFWIFVTHGKKRNFGGIISADKASGSLAQLLSESVTGGLGV